MSKNNENTHQSKTKECSTLEEVTCSAEPALYFHPASGTFLFPNEEESYELENDDNLMNNLLSEKINSELRIEDLQRRLSSMGFNSYDTKILKQKDLLLTNLRDEELRLDNAVNRLKGEMQLMTPMAELPKEKLLDSSSKKNAIGLMELINISGGKSGYKYTYVRSDKISNHIRKYKLNSKEKETGSKSFITTEEYIDDKGNKRKRQVIDKEKLKSQLLTGKANFNLFEKKYKDEAGILGKWAEDLNENLKSSPYKGDVFEFDSQSQLMRWGYGASSKISANPFDVNLQPGKETINSSSSSVNGKLSGYAGLALAESKTTLKLKLPYEKGITITYPTQYGEGILGTIRLDIDITLSGNVGASIAVEAGFNFQGNKVSGAPLKRVSNDDPSVSKIDISKQTIEPSSSAELGVFVGMQASLNVTGSLKWKSPHIKDDPDKFIDLAKVCWEVTAQAGIGVSGALQFTYQNGRVRCFVTGGLCKGVGAKGLLAFDIDGEKIFDDFLPALGYMLRNANYIKLSNIMLEKDFNAFAILTLLCAMGVIKVTDKVSEQLENFYNNTNKLFSNLEEMWDEKEVRISLMNNIINTNGECLKFAPPESKGAAIASLITANFWDEISLSSHAGTACESGARFASRKRAILLILSWAQSKRDYENIMQHLSIEIGKKEPWKENEQKVIQFLKEGEQIIPKVKFGSIYKEAIYNVEIQPSHYAENIKNLYHSLPDNENVQINVETNQLMPLVQSSLINVDSCTRLIP